MRNNVTVLIFLSLLITSLTFYVVGKTNSGHLEQEACNSCHLSSGNVKVENAHQLISSQELLCKRCHPKALEVSHPSGFDPKRKISELFPLDWKGELTCSSCHEIHGNSPGLMRTNLRGRDYCHSCHDDDFFAQMPDLGTALIRSGHLASSSSGEAFLDNIDSYSLDCLGCHNDQTDRFFVSVSALGVVNHTGEKANHPIGRDYEKAVRFGGYRPIAQVPEYILLPEGKVSCVSCHEGYSQKHGKLIELKSGMGLCFHCHDL